MAAIVEKTPSAARPTRWQVVWIAVLAIYLGLSLVWLCDLYPRALFHWFNDNYEHLYTQGPPLALSYWRTVGLQLYGIGTLTLLGLGYAAYRAPHIALRVLLSSLFWITWVFWGTCASAPWY